MDNMSPLIYTQNLSELDKRRIVWGIIKLFQAEGISYRQAVELLDDTKYQLKNIPIKVSNQ